MAIEIEIVVQLKRKGRFGLRFGVQAVFSCSLPLHGHGHECSGRFSLHRIEKTGRIWQRSIASLGVRIKTVSEFDEEEKRGDLFDFTILSYRTAKARLSAPAKVYSTHIHKLIPACQQSKHRISYSHLKDLRCYEPPI
jgi:hypothetical protein